VNRLNGLARTIGAPPRRINEIVLGKRSITAAADLKLARYFGLSDGFWLGVQADYALMERRRAIATELARITPVAKAAQTGGRTEARASTKSRTPASRRPAPERPKGRPVLKPVAQRGARRQQASAPRSGAHALRQTASILLPSGSMMKAA
jgi:addiction module HigA family antidote